jgi:hypothetical protein
MQFIADLIANYGATTVFAAAGMTIVSMYFIHPIVALPFALLYNWLSTRKNKSHNDDPDRMMIHAANATAGVLLLPIGIIAILAMIQSKPSVTTEAKIQQAIYERDQKAAVDAALAQTPIKADATTTTTTTTTTNQ